MDNAQDREQKGRRRKLLGEEHPRSKLTATQVVEMRQSHAAGASGYALAKELGVRISTVHRVIRRKTWKHL